MQTLKLVRVSLGRALAGNPLGSYSPSTRRHGLSGRQNVLRRIYVSIMLLATLWAAPGTDAQGQIRKNVSTVEAPFARRMKSIRYPEFSTVPFALVPKHRAECAERGVGDHAGKTVVLGHATHVQILNGNYVETFDKVSGYLVQVVDPSVRNLCVKPGNSESLDAPPFGPFLFSRQIPLSSCKLLLPLIEVTGVSNLLSSREGGECGYSEIDAYRLMDGRQSFGRLIQAKRDKITVRRILNHRDGSGIHHKIIRPPNPEPSKTENDEVFIPGIPLES